jgi:hypothetical protein
MYGYSAGKFILQTRKSGTWTTRFEISSAGAATFSGAITATGITIGSNDVATESYCDTYTDQAIALLVDSSPATLNTLNELAAALGDDANYAATITTALGLKAPLASPALTGTATFGQLHGTSSTSEIGSGSSTAAIKRIRMHQGGELCFGDVTNANFLGLTEGTVNQFVDTDRLGLYYRNELKLYSNSNTLRVTWDVNGNQTNVGSLTAAGVTSSSNIRFSSGTVGNSTDPGITSSNTNAGIYFASSGVGLGSGSSSKYLFLDSSGNVSTGGTLTAVGDITVTGAGDVNATHLKLNNTGYIQLGTSWANERSLQIKGGPTIGATWNPVDGWTTHGGGFNVTKGSIGWTGTTDAYDFQVRRGGSAKLTATSAGATITGDLNVTTDIDCRDISPRDIIGADDIGASTLTLTGYLGGEVSRLINRGSNTAAKYPLGHYTPGEAVFEVDPTWSNAELQDFFGSGNVSFSNDSTAPGGYSIYINGATNVGAHYGSGFPHIPVDQDDIYYMECWVKGVGSVNHYMGSIDKGGLWHYPRWLGQPRYIRLLRNVQPSNDYELG